jgi:ParB family chromosome partitioning protein
MDPAALEELAHSIETQGIIQPIVVRKQNDGYEIIAGERRWRAAQKAGLTQVPVIVRDLSDQAVLAIALIENIQRQDLNAIEEAIALNRLIEEFQMTHQDAAKAVGRSRAAVTNIIRLLKLIPEVRKMVEDKKLDMGHARALLSLEGDQQIQVAMSIVAKGLSVRQTEQLIQNYLHKSESQPVTPAPRDVNVLRLERDLSDKLGAKVQIQQQDNQRGKLVISYTSLDELDGILEHIR